MTASMNVAKHGNRVLLQEQTGTNHGNKAMPLGLDLFSFALAREVRYTKDLPAASAGNCPRHRMFAYSTMLCARYLTNVMELSNVDIM